MGFTVLTAASWAASRDELPKDIEITIEGFEARHEENPNNPSEPLESIHHNMPTPGVLSFSPGRRTPGENATKARVSVTWEIQGSLFLAKLGEHSLYPFLNYLNVAPSKHPWVLIDAGDGTWQIAQNHGMRMNSNPGATRLFQAFDVQDIEEASLDIPKFALGRSHRAEVTLGRIATEVMPIPEDLGMLPEHAADQTFFVGTEGRTPLSVIVLGYQLIDKNQEKLDPHAMQLRGFEHGSQAAWIVPRVYLENPEVLNFPIYRISARLLHYSDSMTAKNLQNSPNQFPMKMSERWLQFFYEYSANVGELGAFSSAKQMMDAKMNAIFAAIKGQDFLDHTLQSPGGIPLSCSREIVKRDND